MISHLNVRETITFYDANILYHHMWKLLVYLSRINLQTTIPDLSNNLYIVLQE